MNPEDQARVQNPAAADTILQPHRTPSDGIRPGTLLVNTYRVERLLGGGGMGEVYLAHHTELGTRHAVKVIRSSMAANRQVMDLFYREAKVLRGVRHAAVVSYDGFVRDADGRNYLVMEHVDGPSFAERMQQGPLPAEEVLTLRDRLADGLAEAHRQGAIHRDISPDNIILPGNQVAAAKIIDFGLSKLTDPAQESIIGASFAGKFRFASPEQFGMFGGAVDGRSDIYSLGLVLAAGALGRPLDMGNSFEAALHARQSVPDLTGIKASLRPWLTAMLEPDPARRPDSLKELLARWPARTATPKTVVLEHARNGPSFRGFWWWIGPVLLVGAAGGHYWFLQPPSTKSPATDAREVPDAPAAVPQVQVPAPMSSETPAQSGDGRLAAQPNSLSAHPDERTEQALLLSPGQRSQVQAWLAGLGFDPGPLDSEFGAGTRDALRSWQRSTGQPDSGFLDSTQFERLGQEGNSTQAQRIFWEAIQSSGSIAALTDFVSLYPAGQYANLARARIDALREAEQQARREVEQRARHQAEQQTRPPPTPPANQPKGRREPKRQPSKRAAAAQRKPDPPHSSHAESGSSRYTPEQLRALKRFNNMRVPARPDAQQ